MTWGGGSSDFRTCHFYRWHLGDAWRLVPPKQKLRVPASSGDMPKPLASSLSQHISTIRCEGNGHHLAESSDFTIIVTALMIEEGLDGEGLGLGQIWRIGGSHRISSVWKYGTPWYPKISLHLWGIMGWQDYIMVIKPDQTPMFGQK